jgi:hypothetical protein
MRFRHLLILTPCAKFRRDRFSDIRAEHVNSFPLLGVQIVMFITTQHYADQERNTCTLN